MMFEASKHFDKKRVDERFWKGYCFYSVNEE